MMNSILINSCRELKRRIGLAKKSISAKKYPEEVIPCFSWVMGSLVYFEQELGRVERFVKMNLEDNTLDQTWYSELTSINNELEILDSYFIHPLYRISQDDQLALKVIKWLHSSHEKTKDKPFLLSNGSFSIAPSENSPTLYWLPVTSQLSLLHYPLFFHEFGHQLFLLHKIEMESLVREFQTKLIEILKPPVSQSDKKYQSYLDKASEIVETWREWMEELFCDAVGLTIGGKSYMLAFSHFIRLGGVKEFFVSEKYLAKRSHPVSLLRIRFLAMRARKMGLHNEADELLKEWFEIRDTLKINEDYFGYFEDSYTNDITNLIDDMLVEANPVKFDENLNHMSVNYLKLINMSWEVFLKDPETFDTWEFEKTKEILSVVK